MEFNSLIWNKYVKNPHKGDSSQVRGKKPEQDQDGIDPEWEEVLCPDSEEEAQPPATPPGSTVSMEPKKSSKEIKMAQSWDDTEVGDYRMDNSHLEHKNVHWI